MENTNQSSANKQLIALVTGANQGVGFQIAKALGAKGHTVYVGSRKLIVYGASKTAMNAVTMAFALELEEENIKVNAVSS